MTTFDFQAKENWPDVLSQRAIVAAAKRRNRDRQVYQVAIRAEFEGEDLDRIRKAILTQVKGFEGEINEYDPTTHKSLWFVFDFWGKDAIRATDLVRFHLQRIFKKLDLHPSRISIDTRLFPDQPNRA